MLKPVNDIKRSERNLQHYDPTVVLFFRARFLERRGNLGAAISLLEDAQANLQGRLVAAWLKTQLTLATMMRKARDPRDEATAEEGREVASALKLKVREKQFQLLLPAKPT